MESVLCPGARVGRIIVLDTSTREHGRHTGYDPELDRRVTLRVIESEHAEAVYERACALGRIADRHLVAVHDAGRDDRTVHVATEHIAAPTLGEWLASDATRWRDAQRVFVDAARGLAALHAAGLVLGGDPRACILVLREGGARLDVALEPPASDVDAGQVVDRRALGVAFVEALGGDANATTPRPPVRGPRWLRKSALRVACDHGPSSSTAVAEAWSRDPRRSLRVSALALAIVVACTLAAFMLEDRRAHACAGGAKELAVVWSPSIRQHIDRAFLATEVPFAADARDGVVRRLDTWASEWTNVWSEACRDARIRGLVPDDVLAARMACLDTRREDAAALVRLFVGADADVVRESVRAASALPSPRSCNEPGALDRVPLPGDPESREELRTLRRELADAKALRESGKYAAGLALAQRVVAAIDGRDPALQAEALLAVGQLEGHMGRLEHAVMTLREAVHLAWEAGHDQAAFEAWLAVAYLTSDKLARFPAAHRALRHAEATITRTRGGVEMQAELLRFRGIARFAEGDYEDAREDHEQALAHYEAVLDPDDPRLAGLHNSLANDLTRLGRLDEATVHIGRAIEIRERALGSDHPDSAASRNNLGATLHGRGEFARALVEFQRAYEVRRAAFGPIHHEVAESLNNIGATLHELGRDDEAAQPLEESIRIREALFGPDHPSIADPLANLAAVEIRAGRHASALEHLERALVIAVARLGEHHTTVANIDNNMGRALAGLGRYDEALAAHRRALAIRIESLGATNVDTLGSALRVGEMELATGDIRAAADTFVQTIAILPASELRGSIDVDARFGLARATWRLGERARALALARAALDDARGHDVRTRIAAWLHAPTSSE